MTNINPNSDVGKINNIIKKETKVNKEKKVVTQTKQVEASALNALGAYGMANISFKGNTQQTFEQKLEELGQKIKSSFCGENAILSQNDLLDIEDVINENNIELANKLFFGKNVDGKELVENKKLILPLLMLSIELPDVVDSIIKKDDNGNLSVDLDTFYNVLYQISKDEDSISSEIDVDFIKQIFEFKNDEGNYPYAFGYALNILESINSENIVLAKKLIFNKDENGNPLPDINAVLENYNLDKNHGYGYVHLANIIGSINSQNIEFAERLLYSENFSDKRLLPNLLKSVTEKTLPLIEKVLYAEEPILDEDNLVWTLITLKDENIEFAEELFFAKGEDGKDLFPDKNAIKAILPATNPTNINIAKKLCLSGAPIDKEKVIEILRNVTDENVKMAEAVISDELGYSQQQIISLLRSNSKEEAALKDLLMFAKEDGKDIFSDKGQIPSFISSIYENNFPLVYKMFLAKDKDGNRLFPNNDEILKISEYTYDNKRKLCEILCFGKDDDGNELLQQKSLIPQILSKAGYTLDVAQLEKNVLNPDIMKNENCFNILLSAINEKWLTFGEKYLIDKFLSTPAWYKNEYLQKNIWSIIKNNSDSTAEIVVREKFIDAGFNKIANSESEEIQKTFENLLYWVKTEEQALVAEKILSDPLLYENKNIQEACRGIVEYIGSEEAAKAKIEFLDKYLEDPKYNQNEFVSSHIGYFVTNVQSSEVISSKYEMLDLVISSPELLENSMVKNAFFEAYYEIKTPIQSKLAGKVLSDPILYSNILWCNDLKIICNSCKSEEDLKIKLSVIDKYLNKETKLYENNEVGRFIYSCISIIDSEEELAVFDKIVSNENLLAKPYFFSAYYNILTNKNEEQKELQLKFIDKIVSNPDLYQKLKMSDYQLRYIIDKLNTQEDLDASFLLIDKYLAEPMLKENVDFSSNLSNILQNLKSKEDAQCKIDIIEKYLNEPKLYENASINKFLSTIISYTRNEEDSKIKLDFIDKYLADETLQKNEELNNELGRILAVVNKMNKDFAYTLCFDKDQNNNDVFANKFLITKILLRTKETNLSLAQQLCYGRDDNGNELFIKKELIEKILENTNASNIDIAQKLCYGKNVDNEELYEDKNSIAHMLLNSYKYDYADLNDLFDALYNKEISNQAFISIWQKEFTLNEFEEAIKDLGIVDSTVNSREKLNSLSAPFLSFVVKNSKLYGKNNINEIPLKNKKDILKSLMKQNIDLFKIREDLKQDFPLIPTNSDQYCSLVRSLVKSIGIQTNEITLQQEEIFDNATNQLVSSLSELTDEEFNSLTVSQEYSKDSFIQDVLSIVKGLPTFERQKVFDYFGFELKPCHHYSGYSGIKKGYTIVGYPVNLNNGQKLSQIDDEKTKRVVEELRPYVIKFTENNKIICENKEIEKSLNKIVAVLPEVRTFIDKVQLGTQSFDIMKHSLKVMQKIVQNPEFAKQNERDKKILLLASLLHDGAKSEGNVDPLHSNESAFDAFYISQKFNLTKDERIKLYSLIKHHEWLADINKIPKFEVEKREKETKSKAYDLHYDNLFELSKIFTEADLKAVRNNDGFFDRYKLDFETISKEVDALISELKNSQPLLPVTPLPKSSRIKEAITVVNDDYSTNLKGIYVDKNGMIIIKYNEVENETWEKIGFPKGSVSKGIVQTREINKANEIIEQEIDTGNIHFFVHGLNYETQLTNFDSFTLPDSDALLSVSYAERPESKYRFFRNQGVILNTDAKYVHGGGQTDSGSGCGKDIDEFKRRYAYADSERHSDRTFVSKLIKEDLGISDEEYLELVEKYKNRPFTDIEPKELQEKIVNALAKINSLIRKGNRSYNEMYLSNPDVMGYFAYACDDNVGDLKEFIETEKNVYPFIRRNAVEKDLPLIIFGD